MPTAGMTTAADANANTGSTTAFDHGSTFSCSVWPGRRGSTRPRATPAIVACTPEWYTSHHVTSPTRTITTMISVWPQRPGRSMRPSSQNAASATTAPTRARKSVSWANTTAMMMIAMRSSSTASASRNTRMPLGSPRPNMASTPSANAMSVAVGIGHPCVYGVPAVTSRKTPAGTSTPPTAAMAGMIAVLGFDSSPSTSSCLSSMATSRKKTASSPSLIQCAIDRSRPRAPSGRCASSSRSRPGPTGEFATTRPSTAAVRSAMALKRGERTRDDMDLRLEGSGDCPSTRLPDTPRPVYAGGTMTR